MKIYHNTDKSGDYKYFNMGDLIVLICHMITCDDMFKASCGIEWEPSW